MGTASLVLGIISVVTGWACCGIVPGLVSFVLGLISFIKNKDKKGLAGMILSFVGSGAGLLIVILSISGITTPISTFMPRTNSGLGTTTTTTTTTAAGMPSNYEIPSYEEPSWESETSSDYEIDWGSIWGDDDSEKESASEEKETKETKENISEEIGSESSSEKASEKGEKSEKAAVDQNEIRPEVKDAIDSYEDFMDGYIDFMSKYDTASSTEMLMEYMEWVGKYADMLEKMEKMEGDFTDAEAKYYSEVMARISGKMIQFSITQ